MDKIIIGSFDFETLVAITEEDHIQGLMYRPWPPPIMTFPYKKSEVRKFWMRNTISPLDIIFCRNNKIIAIHQGIPLSLEHIGPDEPTDLVVEMPKGMAQHLKLSLGQEIKLQRSIFTVAAEYQAGI